MIWGNAQNIFTNSHVIKNKGERDHIECIFIFPSFSLSLLFLFSHYANSIETHWIALTGDERFVQRLRQASSSESDSDSTSDSDEKEVASPQKPSNVAARAAAVAATGQQQIVSSQMKRQSLPSPQQKSVSLQQHPQQAQQPKQLKGSGKKSRRRERRSKEHELKAAPDQQRTVPLKTETKTKPELIEPLKRAMSSDLIPIDDGSKQKPKNNANTNDNNAQALANLRSFSVMDDGWGV